jgi:alpha-D-xyloside xylohydrolase
MKRTNNYLVDFLDFAPPPAGDDVLWRACKPVDIEAAGGDVEATVPFRRQKRSLDIAPDPQAPRRLYRLKLRAYGPGILRVCIGFDVPDMNDSPMLALDPGLKVTPLAVEKGEREWTVRDDHGRARAVFNRREPETDPWSDLVGPPEETLDVAFFPDGQRAVAISAYDQFFPARHDGMALAFVEKSGVIDRTTISFHAAANEAFVGTGERFAKLDLSGRTIQLENQDGQGVNNRRTYKNVPFYLSSHRYGLFLHTSAPTKLSLADHSTRSAQILVEQPLLDIFLIGADTVEGILRRYRQLTGFPSLPPRWSFGTWMSRMTYFSADEVNEVCRRLRSEDFPCDVIHLDTGWFKTDWLCEWKFNDERFPDPKQFIADLKSQGFRVSLWQMPYIAAAAEQHDEAVANRYIGPLQETMKQGGSNFSALDYAGTIDFTYPTAVEWYQGLLKRLFEMGVACIKTDFGEEIHMNARYHGMDSHRLRNLYALLYQKAAFEITREMTGEGIIWARAGWAGCQRYPVHWGGDAACSWDGMAGSLKGGLHLGLSGFGFWSHDVPGFHGVPNFMNSVVPDDLYVRWTQFGVFTSHLRYHGTSKREPYHYPNVAAIVRRWLKLRYALIPYIVEQSRKVTQSGYPMLRAMIFHHADDPLCWHIHDQYYFGDDFLVAPIMSSSNRRDVYLPRGQWVNLFDGSVETGGKWLKDYAVPLDEMPVWVRLGAKVPVYPETVKCTDEMDSSKITRMEFNQSYRGLDASCLAEVLRAR